MDAIVIGAGFSGLYMVHHLRNELGLSVLGLDAEEDVGGTWYQNRYPGARCDTESHVYCYSFSQEVLKEWKWSGRYPEQSELLAYLNYVATKFDLRRSYRFNTLIESARFDERDGIWEVVSGDGEVHRARFLIPCVGNFASAAYEPQFEGRHLFKGEVYHTGRWPKTPVSFDGKRVGIIGTGSTGVQAVPVVAEEAEHLYVFQRTAQFAIPARHRVHDDDRHNWLVENYDEIWELARASPGGFPFQHNGRSALDATPEERQALFEALWEEGGFKFLLGSYRDVMVNRQANDYVAEFVRGKIRERIADPQLAHQLIPADHPIGSRRPISETKYYEAFSRPNVSLVDVRNFPIEGFTEKGIRTSAEEIPLDVVILATGFDAITGPFLRIDFEGRDGVKLSEQWSDGPRTYLGIGVPGFPNMLMVNGPGSTFGNHPVGMEFHVQWIGSCLQHMLANRIDTIEPEQEAVDAWVAHSTTEAEYSLSRFADSWFNGGNIPGKSRAPLLYFGNTAKYRKQCSDVAADGYRGFSMARITAGAGSGAGTD